MSKDVDFGVCVDSNLNTVCRTNEEGFDRILKLYARPGYLIVDPTFGNGRFWKNIDQSSFDVRTTDLKDGVDLRSLPYKSGSVDMVVLDPPYRYTPVKNKRQEDTSGHGKVDGLYNLQSTNLKNTKAVIELYRDGFQEAHRVLKKGGFLVVKCQDTVQDGKNIWVHVQLMQIAEDEGFACRDLLVVNPPSVTKTRWKFQRHLRKAHSYFLVFRRDGHFPFGIPSREKR